MSEIVLYIIGGFILLDLIIVFFVLWKRRSRGANFNHNFYQSHWKSLEGVFQVSPQQALIDADKLFDHAMRDMGHVQGSFVDKFRKAESLVNNSQQVWNAHKLRNRIAHEAGFQPKPDQVKFALNSFRRGMRDFGIQL